MITGTASLVLDLGNSETRGIVLFGKDASTGRMRERTFKLSNRFAEVAADYIPPADYSPETSTVMTVDAIVNEESVKGTYANGEVQVKEFGIAPIRPSATEKKYNAITTALSYNLALLHGYKAIQSMMRASNMEDIDVNWNVVVLLPPGDIDIGREKVVKIIKSVSEINCSFPEFRKSIKVNKAVVLPEGFCAYIGTLYERGRGIRPQYAYLTQETTLVCDIGAGTTDILIIKDNKVIDTSKHTINRGGNNVTQQVRRALRAEGIVLAENEISEGVINGFVRDGARKVDLTEVLSKARKEIAQHLVADMQAYLEETEFPIRSIGRILVCGGGVLSSGDDKSLGDSLLEYFKKLTPYVELVDFPYQEVNILGEDGVLHKETMQISPRDLNVLGASVFMEM